MNFSEVIGQEAVKERLIQMVKEDRLPHALLFCGPQGAGKMALAMAFASYLLAGSRGSYVINRIKCSCHASKLGTS